jgi:hypothetical protein
MKSSNWEGHQHSQSKGELRFRMKIPGEAVARLEMGLIMQRSKKVHCEAVTLLQLARSCNWQGISIVPFVPRSLSTVHPFSASLEASAISAGIFQEYKSSIWGPTVSCFLPP